MSCLFGGRVRMNVSATSRSPLLHQLQPFQWDRLLRCQFTPFLQFLPFLCWSQPLFGALTVCSLSPANLALTMRGNGDLHGLPSWTRCPCTPRARYLNFIFATRLIGAIMPSTRDTGCSCTALMTFATLARPLTLTCFDQVTHPAAMRLTTSLCLSENGLIFVTRTPTFTGRSNLLRFEDAKPVTGLPRLIRMHSPYTHQCFATLFLLSM
jgi:hypothetical protein